MGIAEKRWHEYDNGLLFLLVHFFREGVFIEKKNVAIERKVVFIGKKSPKEWPQVRPHTSRRGCRWLFKNEWYWCRVKLIKPNEAAFGTEERNRSCAEAAA